MRTGTLYNTGMPNSIEVVLSSGRKLFVGGVGSRDEALQHIHSVRARSREEQGSGLSQWQPRRLVLLAPLTLTSQLPCPINVSLRQLREEEQLSDRQADRQADREEERQRAMAPSPTQPSDSPGLGGSSSR